MIKTTVPSAKRIKRSWYVIDAQGKILGKVASEAAARLIGKRNANFVPNLNVGDKIVITNASKILVSGRKSSDKIYHRYTGFPGGLRSLSLISLMNKDSTEVLRKAVSGMLPKNKLRKERLANLYIYTDEGNPHIANVSEKKK